MSGTSIRNFQLTDELNKTITNSLITTFGLDFLLFEDKKGGDVATIHNARQHQKATRIYTCPIASNKTMPTEVTTNR